MEEQRKGCMYSTILSKAMFCEVLLFVFCFMLALSRRLLCIQFLLFSLVTEVLQIQRK